METLVSEAIAHRATGVMVAGGDQEYIARLIATLHTVTAVSMAAAGMAYMVITVEAVP